MTKHERNFNNTTTDPILAVIATHRLSRAQYGRYEHWSTGRQQKHEREDQKAWEKLFTTKPTTLNGVRELAAHFVELEAQGIINDDLMLTISAALSRLGDRAHEAHR